MTDEDMSVYRAILDASRIVAEEMPDMEEMSVSYKRLRDAFERGDWGVFEDIERGTGGAMRAEVRREAREAALLAIVEAVADAEVVHDSQGGLLFVADPDGLVTKARALLAEGGQP